jgi:single-strand DNA-binding protein
MRSLNKVILIGNLGADPELKYTSSGTALCRFSMATNESWRDGKGDWQQHTEWHDVVTWGRLAEFSKQHFTKGALVYVEGSIRTRKSGDDELFEIHARVAMALGGERSSRAAAEEDAADIDEAIPF